MQAHRPQAKFNKHGVIVALSLQHKQFRGPNEQQHQANQFSGVVIQHKGNGKQKLKTQISRHHEQLIQQAAVVITGLSWALNDSPVGTLYPNTNHQDHKRGD
jgi:hypothetical protein